MIVDTHLHVWSADTDKYPMDGGRASSEDGSIEFLNDTMAEAGVDRAVIVQPIHYLYDNSYVADVLARFPGRFAAIGLVDRQAPDAADQLERLVVDHRFSGLRMHLSKPDDPAEWAAPDQDPIWARAEQLGASFISHGPSTLLPAVEPIIARFPNVPLALDHNGGAPRNEDPPYPLLQRVLDLAKYPNVYVKLTPHKEEESFPYADTWGAFKRIYDAFGPERLMWGTNFPGVMRETGYRPSLEFFRDHIDFLTDDDKELMFDKTPASIYNFGD